MLTWPGMSVLGVVAGVVVVGPTGAVVGDPVGTVVALGALPELEIAHPMARPATIAAAAASAMFKYRFRSRPELSLSVIVFAPIYASAGRLTLLR
jgi:hypothetical protein